jgi:hypothetical protein
LGFKDKWEKKFKKIQQENGRMKILAE